MEKQHSWQGVWITAEEKGPLLRRSFQYKKSGERVYALVAGLGWHELYVNGKKADDRVLAPLSRSMKNVSPTSGMTSRNFWSREPMRSA